MSYEVRFLQALLLTVAVEGAVVVAMMRLPPGIRRHAPSLTKTVAAGIIPSVTTLPYLWFLAPALALPYAAQAIAGEVAVFAAEIALIRLIINLPLRFCALLSFAANGASIIVGLAVFR